METPILSQHWVSLTGPRLAWSGRPMNWCPLTHSSVITMATAQWNRPTWIWFY